MTAPTLVATYESGTFVQAGSGVAAVVTVAAASVGDILVCSAVTEDASQAFNAPTGGTGLTWSQRQLSNDASHGWVSVWTAPVTIALTNAAISLTRATGLWGGVKIKRYSGSTGIGASNKSSGTSGAPSVGLTTTAPDSAIDFTSSDWNGVDGATRTFTAISGTAYTAAGTGYERNASFGTAYLGSWVGVGTAGAKTAAQTAPTGQAWATVVVEILGTTSSVDVTVTAPAAAVRVTIPPTTIQGPAAVSAPTAIVRTLTPSPAPSTAMDGTVTCVPAVVRAFIAISSPSVSITATASAALVQTRGAPPVASAGQSGTVTTIPAVAHLTAGNFTATGSALTTASFAVTSVTVLPVTVTADGSVTVTTPPATVTTLTSVGLVSGDASTSSTAAIARLATPAPVISVGNPATVAAPPAVVATLAVPTALMAGASLTAPVGIIRARAVPVSVTAPTPTFPTIRTLVGYAPDRTLTGRAPDRTLEGSIS